MKDYQHFHSKHFASFSLSPEFKLVCRKERHSDASNTPGEHNHQDFYELVIVLSGNGIHRLGNKEWPIQSASIFLIPPNQSHCYVEYDNLEIYNLLFSKKIFRYFLPDLTQLSGFQLLFNPNSEDARRPHCASMHLKQESLLEIFQILEEMNSLRGSVTPGDKTLLLSDFTRVMLLIVRNLQWDEPTRHLQQVGQISTLLNKIDKNIAAVWTLEKMAASIHMSVSSFRQTFRKLTGQSPIDYLLHQRLFKATSYMENTSYTLEEIAQLCGFTNSSYLTFQFKKHFNMIPSRYRRDYKEGRISALFQYGDA